jgi:hypothetical protein
MDDLKLLLPLVGVVIGWLLKTLTDWVREVATRTKELNKATFYFLRAFKTLLDYERFLRNFRTDRPSIEDLVPNQILIWDRFIRRSELEKECYFDAVEALSSIDPALAIRADNTLKNLLDHFNNSPFPEDAGRNPELYAKLLYIHDELVDFTLGDLEMITKRLARRCGILTRFRIWLWFREREKGEKDVADSMAKLIPELGLLPTDNENASSTDQSDHPKPEALKTSVPWYESAEDFEKILRMIPEAESQDALDYQAWTKTIDEAEASLRRRGQEPVRITIKPAAIDSWARKQSLPVCRRTIARYALENLAHEIL